MKSKNWLIYIIIGVILLVVVATIIIIIRNSTSDTTKNLSKKIEDELKYLDKTTITMINQLNNLKAEDELQLIRTSIGTTTENITSNSNQESSNRCGHRRYARLFR